MASGSAAPDNVALLTQVLETGVGYGIELFDLLRVCQLEDGRFAVHFYQIDPESGVSQLVSEEIFASARKAARRVAVAGRPRRRAAPARREALPASARRAGESCEVERRRRRLGFDQERESGLGPSARA